jgi:hypothetical protein
MRSEEFFFSLFIEYLQGLPNIKIVYTELVNRKTRRGHRKTKKQNSQDKTADKGQHEQDSQNGTAYATGRPGQGEQEK